MTRYLLDVNVLIALVDTAHVQHEEAHAWFNRVGCHAFATCPITENGLLRTVGNPRYPNSPGPPSAVVASLLTLRALAGHEFWPDHVSVADSSFIDASRLARHTQVSDSYLLALACANKGQLATLDRRLATEAVAMGKAALAII